MAKPVPSQDDKDGRDLHVAKASHIALPVDGKTEWHLTADDTTIDPEPNKAYTISMPVICTSADAEGSRFRQISKAFVEDKSVFANDFSPRYAGKDVSKKDVTARKGKYGDDITI